MIPHLDFIFLLTPGDVDYDIETYPNFFCCGFQHAKSKQRWYFEISFRRNDLASFCLFMNVAARLGCRFFGYNNLGFDYPVIHTIHRNQVAALSVNDIYYKAMSIINAEHNARFANMVWESDWVVEQVDLFKMHHFDNVSKSTSLKVLEINMGMDTVEDLPFPVGTYLNDEQADITADYMWHDIDATGDFRERSTSQIQAREELSAKFGVNMMNMSDVKIGETILSIELQAHGIKIFEHINGKKIKRQTFRTHIDLSDVIFPYVQFEHPEFQRIKAYFQSKVITETKGVFENLIARVDGLEYKFGTGGIHMSVESQVIISNDTHVVIDVDVGGYYPALAIKNKVYPEHLGPEYCDALEQGIVETRKQYKKGTQLNEAYKLAANGAYGNSNNEYSFMLDAKYTMTITINGQLLLCMLVEQLIKIPGLRMIQANTDGVTYYCPREYVEFTRQICRWWESVTHLTLEENVYSRMFIRDVNSYIAEKEGGKLKRIGAYAYETAAENPGTRELPWHKDHSMRVVAKAAEAALVRGADIRQFILNHQDPYDFFLKAKVPRSSQLFYGGVQVANIVRYYVSTDGDWLEKAMPSKGPEGAYKRANKLTDEYYYSVIQEISGLNPYIDNIPWEALPWDERINTKNKSRYEASTRQEICSGWTVKLANDVTQYRVNDCWDDIFNSLNYEFYIAEAEKLVKPLLTMS